MAASVIAIRLSLDPWHQQMRRSRPPSPRRTGFKWNALAQLPFRQIHPRQPTSQDRREYFLQEMRCARLRARLLQNDITALGLAVKGGLIDPEQAIEWLH